MSFLNPYPPLLTWRIKFHLASRVVDRDFDAKKADYKGLKNSWKWEWLEKKVGDELISEFIRKINSKGLAFCERCQDINYGRTHGLSQERM
jgi:hypothetical protein